MAWLRLSKLLSKTPVQLSSQARETISENGSNISVKKKQTGVIIFVVYTVCTFTFCVKTDRIQ